MIWRVSDVNENEQYRLHLCQSKEGERFFRLVIINSDIDNNPPSDTILISELVPNVLLRKRDLISISESVMLNNKQRFFVDAHGIWLSDSELREINSGLNFDEIQWLTGRAPIFLPR